MTVERNNQSEGEEMAYSLEVNNTNNVVRIRLTGRVDAQTMLGAVSEMDARNVRHYHQLWDLMAAASILIAPDDLQDLADTAEERLAQFGPKAGKIAIAAGSMDTAAVAEIVQHRVSQRGIAAGVFQSVQRARAWLLEEG